MERTRERLLGLAVCFLMLALAASTNQAGASTISVNVTTDKFQYLYRDLVHVYGNVTYNDSPATEGLVAIQIVGPTDEPIAARTVPAVKIPSVFWDMGVSSFYACNSAGTPVSQFSKPGTAYFNTTVTNNIEYARDILLVITVCDFDATPIGISTLKTNLPAGGSVGLFMDMSIESWVSGGNATAYASVWSDWPENLGYPYCPERNASFSIARTAVPPPVSGMPASYHAAFRLPPSALPGDYQIRVCAFSKGLKAIGSGGFTKEYQELGDIVYDRKIDIFDVVAATAAYDCQSGSSKWNPQADVRLDGIIDIFDVTLITAKYEMSY